MGPDPLRVAVLATDAVTRDGLRATLGVPYAVTVVEPDARPAVLVVGAPAWSRAVLLTVREHAAGVRPVVLVLSDPHLEDPLVLLECGVRAVVPRAAATAARLAVALRVVAAGGADFSTELQGRISEGLARVTRDVLVPRGWSASGLSIREVDLLRLLADGCETPAIARELACSERTVKKVQHRMLLRLGLRNRTQAVARAVRAGLI